jgi:hypothetical protein
MMLAKLFHVSNIVASACLSRDLNVVKRSSNHMLMKTLFNFIPFCAMFNCNPNTCTLIFCCFILLTFALCVLHYSALM